MIIIELPKTAKKIKGSKNTWINLDGKVYCQEIRVGRKRVFFEKAQTELYGYKYCGVNYKNGGVKSRRVHRLVAEAYIPNPHNYPLVGHKNNIKSDNRVENLYWTTPQENTQKACDDGLMKNDKGIFDNQSNPVAMFETKTNKFISVFGSISEAYRETGIGKTTISRQCKYKRPVRKEFYFRYIDDKSISGKDKEIINVNVKRLSKSNERVE